VSEIFGGSAAPSGGARNAAEHRLTAFLEAKSHDAKLSRLVRARYGADLIRERKAEAADAAKATAAETKRLGELRATKEQDLRNAVLRAQLLSGPAELAAETKAYQKLINYYRAREKDAGATKAKIRSAQRKELEARLALKRLTKAPVAGSAASFYAEATTEFDTFGSNIGPPGSILTGQDARGAVAHDALIEQVRQLKDEVRGLRADQHHQTREANRHAKTTAVSTKAIAHDRPQPIDDARLAAHYGY
jgi:hypothetical protein